MRSGESPAIAAYLVPFLAILAASFLSKAASGHFEWLYPLRFLAAAIAIWHYMPELKQINWRFGWLAPVTGAVIFVVWLIPSFWAHGAEASQLGEALAALSPCRPLVLDRLSRRRSRHHSSHRRRTRLPWLPGPSPGKPRIRLSAFLRSHGSLDRPLLRSLRPDARPAMDRRHPRRPRLRRRHETGRPPQRRHRRPHHQQFPSGSMGSFPRRLVPVVTLILTH